MNEICYLSHGAVFKVTRDILEVGDVWAHDLSALELQNAESKRVFETGGSRHLQMTEQGTTHKKAAGDSEHRIIATKGYGATAATSVLTKMIALQTLRGGDGMYSTPASRRAERLFGDKMTGWSKLIKFEFAAANPWGGFVYDPTKDSCVEAFVRMLAARVAPDPP